MCWDFVRSCGCACRMLRVAAGCVKTGASSSPTLSEGMSGEQMAEICPGKGLCFQMARAFCRRHQMEPEFAHVLDHVSDDDLAL